jgi:AcrR family transcriptional regulator
MDKYHHGALREALVAATESLLAEKGSEGFSLREVARRAGVSPAAPAHHFGDASGLLTAVATLGFDGLAAALRTGEALGGKDPRARLREQGVAYVAFAMRYPGRFRLMFRDALRHDDAQLQRAGNAAFLVLEDGVRLAFGVAPGKPLPAKGWTALLALWSAVHGYAHLTIAGRFDGVCGGAAGRKGLAERALRDVLDGVISGSVPVTAKPAGTRSSPAPRAPRRNPAGRGARRG